MARQYRGKQAEVNSYGVAHTKDTLTSTHTPDDALDAPASDLKHSKKTGRDYSPEFLNKLKAIYQPYMKETISDEKAVEGADNILEYLSMYIKLFNKHNAE